MAQHDMVIDNGPGAAVRADMNAAIAAIVSQSSGPVEPTITYAGQFWLDTTVTPNGALKMRNQANTAWITILGSVDNTGKKPQVVNQLVTASGLVIPAGATGFQIEGVGGGGAGGGCPACLNTQSSAAGGGGSGAYGNTTYLTLASAGNPTTYSVTIGAGATGTTGSGGAGGQTTVVIGSYTFGFGGGQGGGAISPATTSSQASAIMTIGGNGGNYASVPAGGVAGQPPLVNSVQSQSGTGGGCPFGSGGTGVRYNQAAPTANNGNDGTGWGSGGGGACSVNVGHSGRLGGAGRDGIIRITFFFEGK